MGNIKKSSLESSRSSLRIPALERGLDLLEWIILQNEPVTLTQIASGLGCTPSEMQRPIACLVERGYIRRSLAGTYIISGRLHHLALSHPPHLHLRRAALPAMLDFARENEQTVHLSIPDGDAALLLVDVPGGGLVRLSIHPAARLDPFNTVSGRILLAFGGMPHLLEKQSREIVSQLTKIKNQGHEKAPSSHAVGIIDLGVPIIDRSGETVAALTTSILKLKTSDSNPSDLLPPLHACALAIGAQL